jgi:uncharacterized membrane protein
MRRTRLIAALISFGVVLLATAPAALAKSYGGEGWYGETSDKTITYAMYLVIIFFPLVIVLLSVIQWRLEKRKHAKMRAARSHAANVDWEGGW